MPLRRQESSEFDADSDETGFSCTETSSLTSLSLLEEVAHWVKLSVIYLTNFQELGTDVPALQTMKMPSASQISEVQRIIQAQTIVYAAVDEECGELERQLASIQARLNETEKQIGAQHAYLSKLRAIPHDILSLIFVLVTQDGADSPWNLLHVNRMWCRVALRTSKIWAGIQIEPPDWQERGYSRWSDGRERCGNAMQLQRALQRAQSTPLNVVILTDFPHRSLAEKYFAAAHIAFAKML